jgi:hypothetical protein
LNDPRGKPPGIFTVGMKINLRLASNRGSTAVNRSVKAGLLLDNRQPRFSLVAGKTYPLL